MLTLTDAAKDRITELLETRKEEELAVRLAIAGRRSTTFVYTFGLMYEKAKEADDVVVDLGEFRLYIDPKSAPLLEGATIDFNSLGAGGFQIDNPNPVWTNPTAQAVAEIIDLKINPAVAGHGGYITLEDVRDNVAYITMGGGCMGCGMASVTLTEGIEKMIREAVPAIREVVDVTHHAAGRTPYYSSPSEGDSPVGKE